MRREVARRAVLAAGHGHVPLAGDLDGLRCVKLHAAPALKQRALADRSRAGDVHHAMRKRRLPPVKARSREDVAVKVVAGQVLRVEHGARRRDILIRALHAKAHRCQQVIGREADGFLVAVRHGCQQLLQYLTRCRHTPSPPLSHPCANAQ